MIEHANRWDLRRIKSASRPPRRHAIARKRMAPPPELLQALASVSRQVFGRRPAARRRKAPWSRHRVAARQLCQRRAHCRRSVRNSGRRYGIDRRPGGEWLTRLLHRDSEALQSSAAPSPTRRLNSLGLPPVCSRNTRLKCERLPKPEDSAMSVIGRVRVGRVLQVADAGSQALVQDVARSACRRRRRRRCAGGACCSAAPGRCRRSTAPGRAGAAPRAARMRSFSASRCVARRVLAGQLHQRQPHQLDDQLARAARRRLAHVGQLLVGVAHGLQRHARDAAGAADAARHQLAQRQAGRRQLRPWAASRSGGRCARGWPPCSRRWCRRASSRRCARQASRPRCATAAAPCQGATIFR